MTSVILIIHIILALAIIGLVLLQRGTGGGLGLGDSGGMGNLATPRSAANILTKATQWCAMLFFGTSLALAIIAGRTNKSTIADELRAGEPAAVQTIPATPDVPVEAAAPDAVTPAPAVTPEPEAPATP